MHEQHIMENRKTERSVAMTTKEINMKHGWHQMVKNMVHYYQTPYDIALIVEQLSNYNSMLRGQIEMEEDDTQQNYASSNVNRYESKLRVSASEYFPKSVKKIIRNLMIIGLEQKGACQQSILSRKVKIKKSMMMRLTKATWRKT